MTATARTGPVSLLVRAVLAIAPLARLIKARARKTIIDRAEAMGVPWRQHVRELQAHDWDSELAAVRDPQLRYPTYYLQAFHAYRQGNLNWQAAWEVEVASLSVHAQLWPQAGTDGDAWLRQRYHDVLQQHLPAPPQAVLDVGCGAGLSTRALQDAFPQAQVTGVDLSPYFLAVARYRSRQQQAAIAWKHAPGEDTGLPAASFDLVSAFLVFHELPQHAAQAILREARRLLRPGGQVAVMEMNPQAEAYTRMPPYVFTLLKSTEPYLDEYFSLDLAQAMQEAGFEPPTFAPTSPRHRAAVARAC
ncbi:MAG: SAM-dependent methyltransferase [Cyanobacteria bacterium QS_8_64_29]|nr:MAG: SAM-dependent methyltransferase [Cyanobacteria bacterium QS_8_64_29]